MANQSDIQSLIQQLAGTHTAGQANVPSAVNNGNPNTVYNVAPPQGGYLPPVTNGYDHWRINPTGGAVNWAQMAQQGGGGMWGSGTPTLPRPPTPVPTTPPTSWGFPTPGGTTPPPSTGGTPPPIMSTNDPPQQGPGPNANGPGDNAEGQHSGTGRGLDWIDLPPGDIGLSDHPTATNTGQAGSIDSSHGWGDLTTTEIQDTLGASLNLGQAGQSLANSALGRALGIKADGTLSVGQVLDWLIPGNVYMAQTGKLNLLNMLPALLSRVNPVLGVAAKAAMTWLAKNTHIRVFKNWLARNQDNRNAALGLGGGNGGHNTGSMMNGGWMGTGGFGHNYGSSGGTWVDSNGNPVDPGSFASYYTDPNNPNNAYSGNTFANGGSHPSNGGGGGGSGGAGGGFGGSSNGSSGSSGGSSRGTGGSMSGRNKQITTAVPKKPSNDQTKQAKET